MPATMLPLVSLGSGTARCGGSASDAVATAGRGPCRNALEAGRGSVGPAAAWPASEDGLAERYRAALEALAAAQARAERAERRLRARLIELTWPASLGGIAGGFAAVVALRLAGM